MNDDISGFEPLGTVTNRIVASVAHRRCNGAVTQHAIPIEQAATAAIAALRTLLDALQARQAPPPAKASVRGREAGGAPHKRRA